MSALQAMIDNANNRTKVSNRRAFARKANDQQHHENLVMHVKVMVGIYHEDIRKGLQVDNNLRAAIREMETALALSEKRLA
jgi:hypothetical protein